jgi:phosphoglycolate phosphatase-like HAD superfamily hydrolase
MKVKALLIDLDGTLIDSVPLIMRSDKAAIEEYGFKVSHFQLRQLSLLHSREIAYFLMDSTKTVFDLFEFIEFRRKFFVKLLRKHKAKNLWFGDSKNFIFGACKSFPLGVVTGSRKRFVKEVFDKKTLKCFKFIITSDDVEHKKPDIEPLLLALKKLKLKKSEVVFIGDSIQDGLMCQRLGVKFIAKVTGISTENQLRKFRPLFVAKNFDEIKSFINLIS